MPQRALKRKRLPVQAVLEEDEFGHIRITLHSANARTHAVLGRLYDMGLSPGRHPFREIVAWTRHTWAERHGNTSARQVTIRFGRMND